MWLHGDGQGLLGTAELIELVDGGALAPVALSSASDIDVNSGRLSSNDRFAIYVGTSAIDTRVYVADLDADDPSEVTVVGETTYHVFGDMTPVVGQWVVWRTPDAELQGVYVGGGLGETTTLSQPGVAIADMAEGGLQVGVCGLLFYAVASADELWMIDLSGTEPSEPQLVHHELPATEVPFGFVFESPTDDRLFYTTAQTGDFELTSGWERSVSGATATTMLYGPGPTWWSRMIAPGNTVLDGS